MQKKFSDDDIELIITRREYSNESVDEKKDQKKEAVPNEDFDNDDLDGEMPNDSKSVVSHKSVLYSIPPMSATKCGTFVVAEDDKTHEMMPQDEINEEEPLLIIDENKPKRKSRWRCIKKGCLWTLVIILLMIISFFVVLFWLSKQNNRKSYNTIYEPDYAYSHTAISEQHNTLVDWLSTYDGDVTSVGCAIKDTMVNDIAVRVYYPLNATPRLAIGMKCLQDKNTILAFQAADIRADNLKIVGSFVLGGEQFAKGSSKLGFCAIIDGEMTISMAENSDLYEKAIDRGGDFFRQYPLVYRSKPQYTELRSQNIRRALCDVEGRVAVIQTLEKSSMHDFSQLLADMGVNNAIYLVGGDAIGIAIDINGNKYEKEHVRYNYKYINFIYWEKE